MAKKKTEETDDLAGTVEGLARDNFDREKAAYEERTGETVQFVPPAPVTRTPIPTPVEEIENLADQPEPVAAEGEGDN